MNGVTMTKPNSDVQVIYNGELLIIDFDFNRGLLNRVKQIDGAVWNEIIEKKWVVPKTSYKQLVQVFGNKIVWKSKEEMKESASQLGFKEETLEDVLERIPRNITTPYMKIEPYDFQKVAVGWATIPKGKRGNILGGLLGDLMGLGKTIEALAISGKLKEEGKIKKCLVICPATLKMQWGQEVEKFTNEKYVIIDGAREKRAKQFQEAKNGDFFYTIINYELLYQKEKIGEEEVGKGKNKKKKTIYGDYIDLNYILENEYDMVVIDEAHRMKNPETQTAAAIRLIQPEYRLLMTGTPIEKDLQNIFQLMDYLSPNILAEDKYDFELRKKMFEDKFLVVGWNPYLLKYGIREKMVKGVKNVGLLKRTIAPYMLRRTTEDVSDELPDATENVVVVDWAQDQKKLYDKLKDDLLAAVEAQGKAKDEEERVKYENEANAMLMYMLATCDTPELMVMSDSVLAKKKLGRKRNFEQPPKLKRLVEMVEDITIDNGDKVVIFSKFERMTRILKRELDKLFEQKAKELKKQTGNSERPHKVVMYTGATAKGCQWKVKLQKENKSSDNLTCDKCPFYKQCDTRTKSAWHFQNDPNTKVIIATDAGNYGVNLQSGRFLINYDLPDSYSVYAQRNGRIRRLGSKHNNVYIYNLVTTDGIDQMKYYKLMKQKELIDQVVEKNEEEEEAVIRITASMEKELIKDLKKKNNKK